MIVFAIARQQFAAHFFADLGEMPLEPFERRRVENVASIFGDEDQMHSEQKNAVPACSNLLHPTLRPTMFGA